MAFSAVDVGYQKVAALSFAHSYSAALIMKRRLSSWTLTGSMATAIQRGSVGGQHQVLRARHVQLARVYEARLEAGSDG